MMINPDRWMREVTIPLVAEEIEALCNGVVAGASFSPGLRPSPAGSSHPPSALDDQKRFTKKAKLDGAPAGEKREHGKFAPGGASQGSPATAKTGSPLDPATSQAEPPKQSAIHKERYDAHTTAAKTYQDLVKQHLNLAKIALDPQDRQRHIDAARGHKQAADQHLQQAETHAQAHSKAVTTEANMAGQGAGGMMAPNAAQGQGAPRMDQPYGPPGTQPRNPADYGKNPIPSKAGGAMPSGPGGYEDAGTNALPKKPTMPTGAQNVAQRAINSGGRLPPLRTRVDPNNQTQQMPVIGPGGIRGKWNSGESGLSGVNERRANRGQSPKTPGAVTNTNTLKPAVMPKKNTPWTPHPTKGKVLDPTLHVRKPTPGGPKQ